MWFSRKLHSCWVQCQQNLLEPNSVQDDGPLGSYYFVSFDHEHQAFFCAILQPISLPVYLVSLLSPCGEEEGKQCWKQSKTGASLLNTTPSIWNRSCTNYHEHGNPIWLLPSLCVCEDTQRYEIQEFSVTQSQSLSPFRLQTLFVRSPWASDTWKRSLARESHHLGL